MEILSTAAANATAPALFQPAAPALRLPTGPTDPGAAAQFSALMSTQPVVQTPAVEATAGVSNASTMGDRILALLQTTGDQVHAVNTHIATALGGLANGISATQVLDLQDSFGQRSVWLAGISALSKQCTQAVDQLTKMQ